MKGYEFYKLLTLTEPSNFMQIALQYGGWGLMKLGHIFVVYLLQNT